MYLVPLATSFSKFLGTKMGVRLLLLAIVGLGALYTIHLLAMDWMKIQTATKVGESSLK
jgi:NADH:ubiquinone oxidoreductase subunit 3 (subunit A)